ncbi:MAG: outer membrane protein assembly factor BamB [Candidatus Latescibacterota bacterium]
MKKQIIDCRRIKLIALALGFFCLIGFSTSAVHAQWAQWGGPNRDFTIEAVSLSKDWAESGPKRLWQRDLGDGYAAIVVDKGVLYTMYRRSDEEVVIALDAKDGKTVWEYVYEAPKWGSLNDQFGAGPHATPLVLGDYVYTVGARVMLHCLNKKTGKKVWSHDLWDKFGAKPPDRGYSSSPVAYKSTLILPVGGRSGHGIVAFDLKSGDVVWHSQDYGPTFSSPKIIQVDGQDQLVVFEGKVVAGLEPNTGDLLWTHPHHTQYDINAMTPVWSVEDNLLFVSSAYDTGSRVIHLVQKNGKTTVEEVWYNKRMEVQHGTAVRLGDMVYGSSGDFGPAFLMGLNAKTGEMGARHRGFAKANVLAVGNDLIVLDENGELGIVTPGSDAFEVHAKASIFSTRAWAVPTLVGTTLYARDRKEITALDLSP